MSTDLSEIDLLSELSQAERETLEKFLDGREIDAGMSVFRRGEESGELLWVVSGSVQLELGDEKLGRVEAGQMLGGMSLVHIGNRTCSAIAEEDCQVLILTRESYLRLRVDFPPIALGVQEAVVKQLAGDLGQLFDDG